MLYEVTKSWLKLRWPRLGLFLPVFFFLFSTDSALLGTLQNKSRYPPLNKTNHATYRATKQITQPIEQLNTSRNHH